MVRDIINAITGSINRFMDLILGKLLPEYVWLNASLFALTVVVFLGLLIYCAYQFFSQRKAVITASARARARNQHLSEIEELREDLKDAKEEIRRLKKSPKHTPTEDFYFNLNGLTSASLLFCMALMLYELIKVTITNQGRMAEKLPEIANEFSLVMGTTVFTIIASAVFVYFAREKEGWSYDKVNKATLVSLVTSTISFLVFVTLVSPIHLTH